MSSAAGAARSVAEGHGVVEPLVIQQPPTTEGQRGGRDAESLGSDDAGRNFAVDQLTRYLHRGSGGDAFLQRPLRRQRDGAVAGKHECAADAEQHRMRTVIAFAQFNGALRRRSRRGIAMPKFDVLDVSAAFHQHVGLPLQGAGIGKRRYRLKVDPTRPFKMSAVESQPTGEALLRGEARAVAHRQIVDAECMRKIGQRCRLPQVDEHLAALQPAHAGSGIACAVGPYDQGTLPEPDEVPYLRHHGRTEASHGLDCKRSLPVSGDHQQPSASCNEPSCSSA